MACTPRQLAAFGSRLAERREAILSDWRNRVHEDPDLVTGSSLPVAQLNDHLTALLENFEQRLATGNSLGTDRSSRVHVGDAAAHGLHRWQQGFDLAELARESGRFNEAVVAEINRCGDEEPFRDRALLSEVHAIWAAAHSIAVSASADQFFKLQQVEAAGHVKDLEKALADLKALEAERGSLWQQAAHDLRGNMTVVNLATAGLTRGKGSLENRERFLVSLDRNVRSLSALLHDVTSLARLQGGQEVRTLAPLDVGELLRPLAQATEAMAQDRGLFLNVAGPDELRVNGDGTKIRRVVQNLLLNAMRYTHHGGVTLSWGDDRDDPDSRWFAMVSDTGPGIEPGKSSALAGALNAATEQSRHVALGEAVGEVLHVSIDETSRVLAPAAQPSDQTPGEGIGLSIVKRLCVMLDATIELNSEPGKGTAFRVVFPKAY